MTEHEALKSILSEFGIEDDKSIDEAVKNAIQGIRELKKYKQIGTVESCVQAMKLVADLMQRKITADVLQEYITFEDSLVKHNWTVASLLEARKLQEADKPIQMQYNSETKFFICPRCLTKYEIKIADTVDFCNNCGQKLDWSEDAKRGFVK